MSPATNKLCLIDPLTLRGRELLELLAGYPGLTGDLLYLHTDTEEEHQIAELSGNPALVHPLLSPEELEGCSTVVVCSDRDTERHAHLLEFLERAPETVLVDMGRLERLWDLTRPAVGGLTSRPSPPHLRVAHPSLVAVRCLLAGLTGFAPTGVTVAAIDPVSISGRESVEVMARQAVQRLQGREVEERIDDQILAFNLVPCLADRLTEEAAQVLGMSSVAFSLTLSGCFHGHLATIGAVFAEPVDEVELRSIWENDARITLLDEPFGLDQVIDCDRVLAAPPSMSPDRCTMVVSTMVDGLLLGGAQTALEIIQGAM